jgi:hypothetical protein
MNARLGGNIAAPWVLLHKPDRNQGMGKIPRFLTFPKLNMRAIFDPGRDIASKITGSPAAT